MAIDTRSDPAALWRIELLGGLKVRGGERPVSDSLPRKAGSLLACLAFYPQRSHPREELMEMLWPDEDPDVTRLRFRQVLATLRRELDPTGKYVSDLIISDRTDVRLNPSAVTTDVAEFESEIKLAGAAADSAERAARLQNAVKQYGGDLLPGFYDDWVSRERQRLSDEYIDAMSRLSDALLDEGRVQEAIESARKAVLKDPSNERSVGCLMKTLAAAGRPSEAIKHYHSLEQTLWKELRTTPSESSRELMEAIRSGNTARIVSPANESGRAVSGSAKPDAESTSEEPLDFRLPEALTPFFGREIEMDFLNSALTPNGKTEKTARLVTLLGPGGAGKTRLALEAARRLQPEYGGAVRFIPLSTLKSEFQLIAALSQALSPHDPSIADSLEHLADSLGISPLLLVLDNFEQMDEDSAVSVRSLLGRAPGLRVLVTSRRPLNVEGERQFNLPPLPVPASEEAAEALLENPSVQLFLDRAGRVKSDFDLTQLNAADIAALCRQLEGMPLALELAAGWASSLSPSQTRERLSRRFDLLVSRRKDIDERHRSLLSAITWSYEQLPIELQRLFARLSVFRGSWTLEAADSICADSAITGDEGSKPFNWSLNGMEQLRERSLIIADQAGDSARFRMLESLREYAELQVPPDERDDLRRNHAYYFLALAEQSASHLFGPEQAEWLHRLEADHGNLCAAVEWAAGDDGVVDVGLRIVAAVARFWDTRYHRADAERLWDILSVKVDSASPSAHAAGIEAMAGLAINQDDHSIGQERLNEAFVIYGDLSDEAGIARIRCWLGASYRDEGRFAEARQLMEASLAFFERHTDLLWKSNALAGLADCALNEGEYQTARSLMEQCAALRRIAGNHRGFAWCKLNEGRTAIIQGELQTAAAFLEESVRLFRMVADPVYLIQALAYLAYVEKHIGDQDRAEGIAGEALTFARRTRLPRWEAPILLLLGDIARDCERPDDARTRYLEATRLCYERELAFGLKCALAGLGKLEDQNGLIERAVCICAAGMKIDSTPDHDPIYSNAINLSVQLEDLERKADHVVFKSAWQRGSTMTPSQVIAYASSEVAQA